MAPFHIIGMDGRLYSRLIPTEGDRGEVAYLLSSTYNLVENTPHFIYSIVNCNYLAVTEDGNLYDLFQRQAFQVCGSEGLPYQFTKVLTKRSHTRALNDKIMVDIKYDGNLNYEMIRCERIRSTIQSSCEIQGIITIDRQMIFSPVYDPEVMDMSILLIDKDETKNMTIEDPRIMDMIVIIDSNRDSIVYLLADDGSLRYHPRRDSYPNIDSWDHIQVSNPDVYRFIKLGDYHAIAKRSGEVWLFNLDNKLQQLDLPPTAFRTIKRTTKSAASKIST